MESWVYCWRNGVAPTLTTRSLEALAGALRADDERILQGVTCEPPPLLSLYDWDVRGGCPICFAGWQGEGFRTVREADEFFARVVLEADARLGEPGASKWFLNTIDDTPRAVILPLLLAEVERTLAERAAASAA